MNMPNEAIIYEEYMEKKHDAWEGLCKRCGACCGSYDGDSCENLIEVDKGVFLCKIYKNRSGTHRTKNNNYFKCQQIRDIINKDWPGDAGCGYKEFLRRASEA